MEELKFTTKQRLLSLGYEFFKEIRPNSNAYMCIFTHPEIHMSLTIGRSPALGSDNWYIGVFDMKNQKTYDPSIVDGFVVDELKRVNCITENDIVNFSNALIETLKNKKTVESSTKVNKTSEKSKDVSKEDSIHNKSDASLSVKKENNVMKQPKKNLGNLYDDLIKSGDIKPFTFFNKRVVNGAELVKMPDGSTGVVASVIAFDSERGKSVEIVDEEGNHVKFLEEPELFKGSGTPNAVICSDENNIYVATYNTSYSYVACYRMGDFDKVWKTPMYGSRFQSITVNSDDVIAFDMNDGKIKYFDKNNGHEKSNKAFVAKEGSQSLSHHDLAAIDDRLLTGNSELKVFDNASGEMVARKDISQFAVTSSTPIAVDKKNNRIYTALKNKIVVFNEKGYIGNFSVPASNIYKLNFDNETGQLLISMFDTESGGRAHICNPKAISELLSLSKNKEYNSELQQAVEIIGLLQEATDSQEQGARKI